MASTTQRILNRATVLLQQGVPTLEALELALEQVSGSPDAQRLATNIFLSLAAKAERCTKRKLRVVE